MGTRSFSFAGSAADAFAPHFITPRDCRIKHPAKGKSRRAAADPAPSRRQSVSFFFFFEAAALAFRLFQSVEEDNGNRRE